MKHRKWYFPKHCGRKMDIEMSGGDGKTIVKSLLSCRVCKYKERV